MKSIETTTARLTVGGVRVYLTWAPPPTPHIQIRLGKSGEAGRAEASAALEVICAMAGRLLAAGVWSVDNLCAEWAGVRLIPPCGVCPELDAIVASVLAAAAAWLRKRGEQT